MLTTTGNQLTVNTLKLRNAGGVYNINTSGAGNVLIAKAIDDNAGTNITINKTGDGLFVLDNTTTAQLANPASVLNLNAGSLGVLLQTGGLSPTGSAAINFNGGGLVLSSKGGNQTYNLPPVLRRDESSPGGAEGRFRRSGYSWDTHYGCPQWQPEHSSRPGPWTEDRR
jgi:hypothetical protein